MKKLLVMFLVLLILLPITAFAADTDPIVGQWYLAFDSVAAPEFAANFAPYEKVIGIYMFLENGTVMCLELDVQDRAGKPTYFACGKWEKDGNQYHCKTTGFGEGTAIIKDDSLLMQLNDSDSCYIRLRKLIPFDFYNDYVYDYVYESASEQVEYKRRDIPSLEYDFMAKGYPQFLYVTDDDGKLNQKCEKSFHKEGMEVYLFMDDTFYLTEARIEYGVQKDKFNSTSMQENIPPLIDFIQIITNRVVSAEDQNNLLRMFINLFNDSESKNNKIKINDFDFTIKIDSYYNLIIVDAHDPSISSSFPQSTNNNSNSSTSILCRWNSTTSTSPT